MNTRERILLTALQLFARNGYEAVSVSDIAGSLGMTKGALYRHYQNKKDIFNSILMRMEERDDEQAGDHGLPEGTATEMEDAYRAASIDQIIEFSKTMFRYWTQDSFAVQFRRMLTLEQFRDEEMGILYHQYLVSGPLQYLTDLFTGLELPYPKESAVNFYAPMFLLYSIFDSAEDKEAVLAFMDNILECARIHLKGEKANDS